MKHSIGNGGHAVYISPDRSEVDNLETGMCTGIVSVWTDGWVGLYVSDKGLSRGWIRLELNGQVRR